MKIARKKKTDRRLPDEILRDSLVTIERATVEFVDQTEGLTPWVVLHCAKRQQVRLTLVQFRELYKGLCLCWGNVKALEGAAKALAQARRRNGGKLAPEALETIKARFPEVPLGALKTAMDKAVLI